MNTKAIEEKENWVKTKNWATLSNNGYFKDIDWKDWYKRTYQRSRVAYIARRTGNSHKIPLYWRIWIELFTKR